MLPMDLRHLHVLLVTRVAYYAKGKKLIWVIRTLFVAMMVWMYLHADVVARLVALALTPEPLY